MALQSLVHPIRLDASGVARVGATRVTLETVVRRFLSGESAEEIADAYSLELSDAYATISYYLQHRPEVDSYLRTVEDDEAVVAGVVAKTSNPKALREKLLARLATKNRAG